MKRKLTSFFIAVCAMGFGFNVNAQDVSSAIQQHLDANLEKYDLQSQDVANWTITDNFFTEHNHVRHIHIAQTIGGIRVENAVANVTIGANGNVLFVGSRFVENLASKVQGSSAPGFSANQAIQFVSGILNVDASGTSNLIEKKSATEWLFSKGAMASEDINVKLLFWTTAEQDVRLTYKVSVAMENGAHWWQVFVDANSGQEVARLDWVTSCDFEGDLHEAHEHKADAHTILPSVAAPAAPPSGIGQYNVYALPTESPIHSGRTLVTSPSDTVASPYGWHDTDGSYGAEYTITRGNNVYAYTDTLDNNTPEFSPDGGSQLDFDFFLNPSQAPSGYQDVSVTNLFFTCNRIHDLTYRYGFDEQSGNFQNNNYGNGGAGSDEVNAEAQDGGGTSNANFSTPDDGNNGRMQMYIWPSSGGGVGQLLTVNTPPTVAGNYDGYASNFGAALTPTPLVGDFALASDGTLPDTTDICDPVVNGSSLVGKIALVRRGACSLTDKVLACQNEGAIAVIIVNDATSAPISPNGTEPLITIPSIMCLYQTGEDIIAQLNAGQTVNGSLQLPPGYGFDRDGDLDNGIVLHEYGHGISNRLTGGPSNSGCLSGDEQMGEGWSDYFAIAFTMDMGTSNPVHRPMATYALSEPTTGTDGLRAVPYDTSFAVNSYTYGDIASTSLSVPHGVGFVWATMLWDLNWALIDVYGYDANIDSGSGGNNICMQLVLDGLKLQPCGPGFVDGRDAILLADQINNGGVNQCLIWEVFRKRGLGASADQGSSGSRSDGTEAFDLPLLCQVPIQIPTSDFDADYLTTCDGTIYFNDLSTDVPQTWAWDFGDGNTDTVQNPVYIYTNAGIYDVTLIVCNSFGCDTFTQAQYITVQFPNQATATDGSGCSSDSILLTATGNSTILWHDANGDLVGTGPNFYAPPSVTSTTFYATNAITYPTEFVGPSDNGIGSGGNHASGFTGTVDFTADVGLTIVSAWVESGVAGPRTVFLWDAGGGNGNIIQTLQVDVPFTGPGRVDLGFEVPGPGQYSIGLDQAELYRNDGGASYPYIEPGLMTITGSSAGADFYYYFYDLEVTRTACLGDSVAAIATVTSAVDFSYSITNLTVDFTDLSVGATSWFWDFGDANTSTAQSPTHTYAAVGYFDVMLVVDGGACNYMETLDVGGVGFGENGTDEINVFLYPNPAHEQTTVVLSEALSSNATVQLFSIDGRMISTEQLAAGNTNIDISLKGLSAAMYWIVLQHENGRVQRKLMVR
jgi:PKD repeat protein